MTHSSVRVMAFGCMTLTSVPSYVRDGTDLFRICSVNNIRIPYRLLPFRYMTSVLSFVIDRTTTFRIRVVNCIRKHDTSFSRFLCHLLSLCLVSVSPYYAAALCHCVVISHTFSLFCRHYWPGRFLILFERIILGFVLSVAFRFITYPSVASTVIRMHDSNLRPAL